MSRTHELKILKCFADSILTGEKTFEIRKNDRGFQRGDLIEFKPINDRCEFLHHDICNRIYTITYVMNGFGLKNGYVVLGIKEVF